MQPWLQVCRRVGRTLWQSVWSLVLWTVWLALGIALAAQLYIATSNELTLPEFALREIEARLAQAGLRATFSRTEFDPTGRLLVENVRLSLPTYPDPVATARSVYVRLNPLALIVGSVEPVEVRVSGATLNVPASLTPSGRVEKIVRDLEATLEPESGAILVRQANAHVFDAVVSASGVLPLHPHGRNAEPDALQKFLARDFAPWCRQAFVLNEQLAQFEEPTLRLDLAPSEAGAIGIQVTALARSGQISSPFAIHATQLRATTRLLLFGDNPSSAIELSADTVQLPADVELHGVQAHLFGQLRSSTPRIELREITVTIDAFTAMDADLRAISAQLFPQAWPRLDGAAVAEVLGAPLAVRAQTNLREKSADVQFSGEISPRVLDLISRRVGKDVRQWYSFDALTAERAEARFGANWKFEKLTAHVRVPRMNSYGVIMEDGHANVELEPHRFYGYDAYARVGTNFARGSYEHDLQTQRYRFLLAGQLRPLEISTWFRDWWPNFFQQFEFPVAPPEANVDVQGMWRDSREANVFLFAETAKAILRGTEFDRTRTRIFTRPNFVDTLEILATRGDGEAHGRFTYVADPATHDWQSFEFGVDSSFDLDVIRQMLGPVAGSALAPFKLAEAPELRVRGTLYSASLTPKKDNTLEIDARTSGEFRFHDFPLQDLSFKAVLQGDEVALNDVQAQFAGGAASGHARVWGTGAERRLGFDFSLADATLGQVAGTLQTFFAAQKKGGPPPASGKFVQEKANVHLDFAASAEGKYADPWSYHGGGNVALRGAEIGEVPLLGTLSELVKFTALRFTEARSNFKIEGTKLVFPKVELRGANSAIDAHGEYAFDRRELDFNAKVFPFHESENILKTVVGAVLTPLSNALEVKLSGTLEKPHWAFVIGPTNLLRSIAESGEPNGKNPAPAASGSPEEKTGQGTTGKP